MTYDYVVIGKLLDFIAQPESGGDYNIVWGGIRQHHRPSAPLTNMTIGAVLAWQDGIDRYYPSEAAGKYQIMEDTLRGLYRAAGLSEGDLFNQVNQDKLATQLLRRRGLDAYLSGEISAEKFAQSLSKEWASLPAITFDRKGRPAKGQSYYAGDGLNKAHVTQQALLQAVAALMAPQDVENPLRAVLAQIHELTRPFADQ